MSRARSPLSWWLCVAAVLAASLPAPGAHAEDSLGPPNLAYQGVLLDDAGNPLRGPVDLTVSIHRTADDRVALYTEVHRRVPLRDGVFQIRIGTGADPRPEGVVFGPAIFEGAERWLEMIVDPEGAAEVLAPRQPFSSVAYALQAPGRVRGWELVEGPGSVARCPAEKVVVGGGCRGCQQGSRPEVGFDGTHRWRCLCSAGSPTAYAICAEAAPVCGDGRINQPSEECDGSMASACASVCLDNCTCEQCGDGVCADGENCSNCAADCGACVPLWSVCPAGADPSKVCLGGACISDVCRPTICSTANPDVFCAPPPGFTTVCSLTGFPPTSRCSLRCDAQQACPNDLSCNGSFCGAP
ncbi:MAG: hypothetical protein QNK03_12415 [Myxococcota bacterium]|nr:hypothetical protein [Myxococcota bacterium]